MRLWLRRRFTQGTDFTIYSSSPRCERLGAEPSSCEALSDSWSALRAGGAEIVGEQVLADGRVLIRYVIPELNYSRTTALSSLEATLVRYVVARARHQNPDPDDRARIELALGGLAAGLPRPNLDADAEIEEPPVI